MEPSGGKADVKPIRALVLAVALVFSVSSCAAVVSTLPKVVSIVSDAALIVDAIDSFVDNVFQVKPDTELQSKVDLAIARTRLALAMANRLATGTEKITQAQLVAAFEDFRVAYQELLALVAPLGVSTSGDLALKATAGGLQVPEPMALRL